MDIIQKDISLKQYSNFKIGGIARYFLEVKNKEDLVSGLKNWQEISKNFSKEEQKIFILGDGTNVLFSDRGFAGLVIHNCIKDIKILDQTKSEELITKSIMVGAGVLIKDLLDFCVENSLSGLEWAGGLPGTVGGAIRGNAGAFGGEIKDTILEVTSLDCSDVSIHHCKNRECKFGYRDSIFKREEGKNEIILSAIFRLNDGNKENIKAKIEEKIIYRKSRHPLEFPNVGSIFKNIPLGKAPKDVIEKLKNSIKNDPFPILPTAKLLSAAGLKGLKVGSAQVSEKHPNFIVNLGNARAFDVLELISQIKEIIENKYKIKLEEEITFLR